MAQENRKSRFPAPLPNPTENLAPDYPDQDEPTNPDIAIPKKLSGSAPNSPPTPAETFVQPTPPPTTRMPEMGPIEIFMKDPTITEIMVNDIRNVMIEREGKLSFSGFTFTAIDELNRVVRNILEFSGRNLTPEQPYADLMLPDGSRVNIVGPPITVTGPSVTIRKFPASHFSIHDLLAREMLDRRMAFFMNACIQGRLNILISGGTGSGKTTLLNSLTDLIPKGERLITIEDTAELSITHTNSVRMQTQPATPFSDGISARDLMSNALRMRPDRIIIGECRRGEAFDMLQAMNTGHEGSITSIHANSTRDALVRLETLGMMAGVELPLIAIRKQIANAVDLIVQIKRHRSGKRRMVSIAEVTGMEGDVITVQDVFQWESRSGQAGHEGQGVFKITGLVPTFMDRLREAGIEFPAGFFG